MTKRSRSIGLTKLIKSWHQTYNGLGIRKTLFKNQYTKPVGEYKQLTFKMTLELSSSRLGNVVSLPRVKGNL